jgi:hypothetical protein
MDLDFTKSSLWISILIGALIVAAASAGFQNYSDYDFNSTYPYIGLIKTYDLNILIILFLLLVTVYFIYKVAFCKICKKIRIRVK